MSMNVLDTLLSFDSLAYSDPATGERNAIGIYATTDGNNSYATVCLILACVTYVIGKLSCTTRRRSAAA